jgi:RNA polymerase sigma factor (sigma-70 family)
MRTNNDMELLQDYALHNSEDAFAALVSRYVNLVYSVGLRQTGNRQHAEEITQAVFLILARKAKSLRRETVLSSWLFQTARLTAANLLRAEVRRSRREQEAYMQSTLHHSSDDPWNQIAPVLNDAIADLGKEDRNAIILRYLQGMDLKNVGDALGISADTAQKRISRALEKLRGGFGRRGFTISGAALGGALAANSIQAAPVGLAAAIATTAIQGTALTASTLMLMKGTLNVMAWTKLQVAIGVGVTALIAVESYEIVSQKKQLTALQQQVVALKAPAPVPAAQPVKADDPTQTEVARLTREVQQLREQMAVGIQAAPQSRAAQTVGEPESAELEAARQLGLAVTQGDAAALGKLAALARAEFQYFNTNRVNVNDADHGDLARKTFLPLQTAFQVITDEATKGNPNALQALSQSVGIKELQGTALASIGILAGNGDEVALDILTNPSKYGVLQSSAVSALKPAAERGVQKAIDALAAVTRDPKSKPLWHLATEGLSKAAASGNDVAVDALINVSTAQDEHLRREAVEGLQRAALNQNAKAIAALQTMKAQ